MTAFVTGGSGFVGGAVIRALVWTMSLSSSGLVAEEGLGIDTTRCMALTYPGVTRPPSNGPPTATMTCSTSTARCPRRSR